MDVTTYLNNKLNYKGFTYTASYRWWILFVVVLKLVANFNQILRDY